MDERLKQLLVLGREHYERREYDRAERAAPPGAGDHRPLRRRVQHARGDPPRPRRFRAPPRGTSSARWSLTPTTPRRCSTWPSPTTTSASTRRRALVYARVRERSQRRAAASTVRPRQDRQHARRARAGLQRAGCRAEAIEQLQKAVDLCPAFADLQTKPGHALPRRQKPRSWRAATTRPRARPTPASCRPACSSA